MSDFNDGDILRIGMKQRWNGEVDIVNVCHFYVDTTTGATFAQMSSVIQSWSAAYFGNVGLSLHDQTLPVNISVSNPTQGTVFGAISWLGYGGGAVNADPLPPQVCALGYIRTAKPRVQMRQYFGVFTEAAHTGSVWLASVITNCQAALNLLMTRQAYPAMGGGIQGVAYNRTLSTYQFGTSYTTSNIPVIQRRRRQGRGS